MKTTQLQGRKPQAINNRDNLSAVLMAAWKACEVLPLSVLDLAEGHRGTIQGQLPLLQHSHSCTLLKCRLLCRNREKGQCGQERYSTCQRRLYKRQICECSWLPLLQRHSRAFADDICHLCQCVSRVLLWSDILRVYWPSAFSPQQRTVEKVQSW